jgi:hypothetical protein
MYRVCVEAVTSEVGHEYKLFEDRNGVRHWRYRFAGLLLVCGQGRSGGREATDDYPTCLTCIMVLARDEQR